MHISRELNRLSGLRPSSKKDLYNKRLESNFELQEPRSDAFTPYRLSGDSPNGAVGNPTAGRLSKRPIGGVRALPPSTTALYEVAPAHDIVYVTNHPDGWRSIIIEDFMRDSLPRTVKLLNNPPSVGISNELRQESLQEKSVVQFKSPKTH
ncbi:hypothetical protein EVAR_4520_1 [Eumeta japonica]|uniref:Uncharacterized protein n=1 Tax=Eumeta variegata TaxID=151549 RepID=A0A4C1SZC6_EUMVA|nr:hypothetical protein EVAR_4520_1 [Eumeta japonica]